MPTITIVVTEKNFNFVQTNLNPLLDTPHPRKSNHFMHAALLPSFSNYPFFANTACINPLHRNFVRSATFFQPVFRFGRLGVPGLEPGTVGLKGHCSTIELYAGILYYLFNQTRDGRNRTGTLPYPKRTFYH